jgi:hypothetical protein
MNDYLQTTPVKDAATDLRPITLTPACTNEEDWGVVYL